MGGHSISKGEFCTYEVSIGWFSATPKNGLFAMPDIFPMLTFRKALRNIVVGLLPIKATCLSLCSTSVVDLTHCGRGSQIVGLKSCANVM